MSNLNIKILSLSLFVFVLFVAFSAFGFADSSTQHCYVSPDFSTWFSSAQQIPGNYLVYNEPCSKLFSSYLKQGCCLFRYSDSSILSASSVTLGQCQYVIGSKASYAVFLPGVSKSNCSSEALASFDCRKLNLAGKCMPGSIYYCDPQTGKFIANCSKCSVCSAANLTCDSSSGYCASKSAPIYNFNSNEKSTLIFTGSVKSSDGHVIPGASVFFFSQGSSSYYVLTNSSGKFYLDIVPGTYIVLVSYPGYAPLQQRVSVSSSEASKDFVLSTHASACDLNNIVFKATNIPGKPWIKLSWNIPLACSGYSFSLYRNSTFLISGSAADSFIDKFSDWGTYYNYSLQVTLANGSSRTYSQLIYSGDEICKGVIPGYEFCYDSHYNKGVKNAVLRGTCDNHNRLMTVSSNDYPSNCSSLDSSNRHYTCAPAPHHKTVCVPELNCSSLGGPFGLLFSKDTCLADDHYCYYDTSSTVVDVCYNCFNRNCLDFNSKTACLDNNCGLDCYWVPVNNEFNKGLCLPAHGGNFNDCGKCNGLFMNCSAQDCSYLGSCFLNASSDNCEQCSSKMTCSDYKTKSSCEGVPEAFSDCAGKGEIVSSVSKCCPGLSFLPIYDTSAGACLITTEGVCTNTCGDGICEQNLGENSCNCPQDCSSPSTDKVVDYVESKCSDAPKIVSFDSCGLEVCRWSDNRCLPANNQQVLDCSKYVEGTNNYLNCLSDVHRPSVSITSRTPVVISRDNPKISFRFSSNYDLTVVKYAIAKYSSCPDSSDSAYYSLNNSDKTISFDIYKYMQDHQTNFSGSYYLIFYVKDIYGLGSLPEVVNFYYAKPGLSFSDFKVVKGLDMSSGLFNVLIDVKLSTPGVCSYKFINSSGSDVKSAHVKLDTLSDKSSVKTLVFSEVPPGNYNFYINCSDDHSSISYSTQLPLVFNPNFNISVEGASLNRLYYGNYPILLNNHKYTVTLVYNSSINISHFYAYIFKRPDASTSDKKAVELKLISNKTLGNKVLANYSLDLEIPSDYFVKSAKSFVLFGEFYINATSGGRVVPSRNVYGEFFKVLNLNSAPYIHIG